MPKVGRMTVKILLVDDNPTFLGAVWQLLDMLPGVEVIGEAHDGREALVKAAELKPDLILLDVAMPEMSGVAVALRMKTWAQAPRIVFLSMHDNAAYREAAHNLGALGFVGKADLVDGLLPILERLVADDVAPARPVSPDPAP